MHIKRLMRPNGGKRVMPCGRFLPGKFRIRQENINYWVLVSLTDKNESAVPRHSQ